ncbi:serine/threonine-protein kinase [Actinosynnema sp. NPDC023658]|uniref:serine/threonine-protein kinase n=1 Tax=Actinosynnema sp. NPDC023658 TaxID=3155465 RepID=UPI0033E52FA9
MAESGGTGTVGGRYALVERVGSGAMGVVWRARDELLDREVAVKQLRWPDLTAGAAEVAKARAMREARNAARLQHPHAVSVFDVVVEDDRPWLVMEYLPSRSLAGLLAERGGLSPVETARIGGQVAAALAAAHAAGIVHRDVKPSNVLIGHDGTVKLTDFGISRATGDGTLTDSGMIPGTPAYLAPEVARGEQPDEASDMFSLGATLYAATEGQSPHGISDNSFGLLYRAAAGRIEPPRRSGPLTGVLTRMLAADPTARPTAAEAVELLAGPGSTRSGEGWSGEVRVGGSRSGGGRAGGGRSGEVRVGEGRSGEVRVGGISAGGGRSGEVRAGGGGASEGRAGGVRVGGGGASEGRAAESSAAEGTSGSREDPAVKPLKRRWLAPVVATVVLLVIASAVVFVALRPEVFDQPPTVPQGYTTENAMELTRSHYELLPESPDIAWQNLAESYRQPIEDYRLFWSQYDDVRTDLFEAVQDQPTRFIVRVRVTFIQAGAETAGRYQLVVEESGGRLRITASELLI